MPLVNVAQKYSTTPNFEFCPVWKVGTTTIKRLFLIKNRLKFMNVTDPYGISFLEPYSEKTTLISNDPSKKRFMFVRNPYDRLLSVYIDKLLAPNPYYWKALGVPAIKFSRKNAKPKSLMCGHDLRFAEFVRYVLQSFGIGPANITRQVLARNLKKDWHIETMTNLCKPCQIKYDFVGKMDTFGIDIAEMLNYMKLVKTNELLYTNGSVLATLDAIKDTTYQPFDPVFQKGFMSCNMDLKDTLQRAWLKLQARGLIGRQDFELPVNTTFESITYDLFLKQAVNAYENSTAQERYELKREHYKIFYLSVPKSAREKLKQAYAEDFRLFEYSNVINLD